MFEQGQNLKEVVMEKLNFWRSCLKVQKKGHRLRRAESKTQSVDRPGLRFSKYSVSNSRFQKSQKWSYFMLENLKSDKNSNKTKQLEILKF